MNVSTSSHFGATILYLVGIALVATSQATPSWISNRELRFGLYQLCTSAGCSNIEWTINDMTLEFFVSRIVLLGADLFIIAGILTAFIAFCLSVERQPAAMKTSGALNTVAGVCVWAGAATFTALNLLVGIVNTSNQSYLYGFIMCWIAGFLFVFGGIIDIMAAAHEVELPPSAPVITYIRDLPQTQPPAYNPAYIDSFQKVNTSGF